MTTIGALAFHLFLPWAWRWVGSLTLPYAPWFIKAATLTITFLLFYLVLEPIRVRRGHWSTFVWYPPLWISPLLACALAAVIDHAVYICAHSIRPHWQQMDVIPPIFVVFLLADAATTSATGTAATPAVLNGGVSGGHHRDDHQGSIRGWVVLAPDP